MPLPHVIVIVKQYGGSLNMATAISVELCPVEVGISPKYIDFGKATWPAMARWLAVFSGGTST